MQVGQCCIMFSMSCEIPGHQTEVFAHFQLYPLVSCMDLQGVRSESFGYHNVFAMEKKTVSIDCQLTTCFPVGSEIWSNVLSLARSVLTVGDN